MNRTTALRVLAVRRRFTPSWTMLAILGIGTLVLGAAALMWGGQP